MKLKSFIKKNIYIILIVILAALLRFYQVSSNPPSLNWDEVAIGWNAKSIFHTRRDEFGRLLPLSFQSFGDFKSPLLIYLLSPFVGLLGLKVWIIRLPSAMAGSITVLISYFLSKIFAKYLSLDQKKQEVFALTSSLLLALSPWHIFFSRAAFEANIALMFITLGTWLFFISLKNNKFIILSGLSFLASLYSYHSPKIFLPPYLLLIFFLFRSDLIKIFKKKSKQMIIYSFILLSFSLPIITSTFNSQASQRAKGTTIFFNQEDRLDLSPSTLKNFGSNYAKHFKSSFLLSGTKDTFRIGLRDSGLINSTQYLFLIIGLIYLLKIRSPYSTLILFWLFWGLAPSVIGKDIVPNNIRSLNSVIPITLISSYGFTQSIYQIKSKKLLPIFISLIIIVFSLKTYMFLREYFIDFPVYSAKNWQYGYQQVIKVAQKYEDQVDYIIFTGEYGQPHVFTYFFQNREPISVFWGGMIKYWFQPVNWLENKGFNNFLIIGTPDEIPFDDPLVVDIINYPDGKPAFIVAKTDIKK